MATMPTIDFGNRQLETPGGLITPETNTGASRFRTEMGRDIQHSLDTASRALYGIAEIKDRADERDARYAMQQAENWFDSKWNGTDAVGADGKTIHTPGVADRDFRQMEMDGTDSMTECRKLKREFRETDIYKNLGAGARRHFDRQFAIYEGKLDNAAAANHRKLTAQKIKVQTEADAAHTANGVQMNFGADDVTFENSAAWGATQMTRLKLGSLVENGEEIAANDGLRLKDMVFRGGKKFDELKPEEQKYVKDIYEESVKEFRKGRIKAMADAASTGNGLGVLRPEQCLDKALEMTFVMNGAGYGFRPDGTKKGTGWLGPIKLANGAHMTEFSIRDAEGDGENAVKDANGNFIDYPSLVPGMTREEINAVGLAASGNKEVFGTKEWASAVDKARAHAKKRIAEGQPVWAGSGMGKQIISDDERNNYIAYIEKAGQSMTRIRTARQADSANGLDAELDKIQWDLTGMEDPKKLIEYNFNDDAYRDILAKKVVSKEISADQANTLFSRYCKMHKDRDTYYEALTNPTGFAEKTDPVEWVKLNKMITEAEDKGTDPSVIQAAVEAARPKLTNKDYLSLWKDCRKQRNAQEDRILNEVFSTYLGIDEFTTGIALDRSKRQTSAGQSAVSTLLGSGSAEYYQSGKVYNPDFTIEDVDTAKEEVKQYLKEHPGDREGARKLLDTLSKPASQKARAAAYRDRIRELRKSRIGKQGAERNWSVDKAYGEEDPVAPAPASVPKVVTQPGKVESRRPTRRHN